MDLLQIKNEQAKTMFMSADFQERWQAYKKAFGQELDDWFGDAYTLKVRVAESLSYLYENRLYEAYAELRHFASVCTTDQDKRMLDKLITLCKNQKEMKKAKVGDWVRQSHGGYYQIVRRTPLGAVIKKAFDHKLVFVGESAYANDFSIVLTDLDTYQFLKSQEHEAIERFFALRPEQRELFLKQTDAMLALRGCVGFQTVLLLSPCARRRCVCRQLKGSWRPYWRDLRLYLGGREGKLGAVWRG